MKRNSIITLFVIGGFAVFLLASSPHDGQAESTVIHQDVPQVENIQDDFEDFEEIQPAQQRCSQYNETCGIGGRGPCCPDLFCVNNMCMTCSQRYQTCGIGGRAPCCQGLSCNNGQCG